MRFRHLLAAAACAAAFSSAALAQSFTGKDVESFMTLMDRVEGLRDKYPDEELQASLPDGPMGFSDLLGADGRFKIFSTMADRLGEMSSSPAARDFSSAVKESGFKSLGSFGDTADSIMMAYMALSMDEDAFEGMEELKNMDPSMLAMMPEGVRTQMAGISKLAEAVQAVPEDDLDTLRPYQDELNDKFGQ
ncbi:hypothetical protein [Parvularcula dongshanensis]|uniref:DUF2059 domain-containing protein n=1 Tax=Parvularcula dongshanensis TaxID=1173995 RepID=A0A840I2F5_9PROT|nr:hypothetical protein [Parvularcula dongshanensis]MBB4658515.1 hypothetical protein [Parvularcula dongshanensis]